MLYHGTHINAPSGFKLTPQASGFTHSKDVHQLEVLFEQMKPQGMISRKDAVYLSDDPDLIDAAGGYTDVIYRVKPVGHTERSDLAWYTKAQEILESREEGLEDCIQKYWAGTPFPDSDCSCFEFRCRAAHVVSIFELNVDSVSELALV